MENVRGLKENNGLKTNQPKQGNEKEKIKCQ